MRKGGERYRLRDAADALMVKLIGLFQIYRERKKAEDKEGTREKKRESQRTERCKGEQRKDRREREREER